MKISTLCLALGLWVLFIPSLASAQSNPDPNLLTPDQKKYADEALRALRKIESITHAGVTQREYQSRTLDMVQTVDEALRHLPESELKKAIDGTKGAYASVMGENFGNDNGMRVVRIMWGAAEQSLRNTETLFESGRLNKVKNP